MSKIGQACHAGRSSWLLTLVVALIVAACSKTPAGELSPSQAAAPVPPEGVVVGVVVVAQTPSVHWGMAHAVDVNLVYRLQRGGLGWLMLARSEPPSIEVYEGVENGLAVSYRPFAFKLKGDRAEFSWFSTTEATGNRREVSRYEPVGVYKDKSGNWQQKWEWRTETITTGPSTSVRDSPVPPATFDIEPGRVVYIGRAGMLLHVDQQNGPGGKPCARLTTSQLMLCLVRVPFLESDPDADLAMIRQHFPKLAGLPIEVRPIQAAPGSWKTLSDAVRPYAAGR